MYLLDVPYKKELVSVREFLAEEFYDFPVDYCVQSSLLLKKAVGLPWTAGIYIVHGTPHGHAWNYDPIRRLFVDINHDGFDKSTRDIAVLPFLNPVLIETARAQKLVSQYEDKMMWDIDRIYKDYLSRRFFQCSLN